MSHGPAPSVLRHCSIAACERKSYCRSLCKLHYDTAWRRGELPPRRAPRGQHMVDLHVLISVETEKELHRLSRASGQPCSSIARDILRRALLGR